MSTTKDTKFTKAGKEKYFSSFLRALRVLRGEIPISVLLTLVFTHAPAGALESVVIAYPTTSSQFAPLWFARDVGLYEKYGLDAKLVFVSGGSVLLQAMLAGQAQAAQNGVADTVPAILRGGDVRMLGVTAKIFPYSLIAAKNIKGAKDLIGGRVAIN